MMDSINFSLEGGSINLSLKGLCQPGAGTEIPRAKSSDSQLSKATAAAQQSNKAGSRTSTVHVRTRTGGGWLVIYSNEKTDPYRN